MKMNLKKMKKAELVALILELQAEVKPPQPPTQQRELKTDINYAKSLDNIIRKNHGKWFSEKQRNFFLAIGQKDGAYRTLTTEDKVYTYNRDGICLVFDLKGHEIINGKVKREVTFEYQGKKGVVEVTASINGSTIDAVIGGKTVIWNKKYDLPIVKGVEFKNKETAFNLRNKAKAILLAFQELTMAAAGKDEEPEEDFDINS